MHAGMEHFLSGKQWQALHVGGPGQEGFSAVQCRDQESSVSRLQSPHLAVAIACTLGLGSAVRALHGSTPRLSTAAGEERRSCRCYAGSPRPCAGPAFLFGFAAGARRPGRPGPGAKHSLRLRCLAPLVRRALIAIPFLVATRRWNLGMVLLSVAQQMWAARTTYIYTLLHCNCNCNRLTDLHQSM